jgi:hypothetical protein
MEAEHEKSPMDARRTPGWILRDHQEDQFTAQRLELFQHLLGPSALFRSSTAAPSTLNARAAGCQAAISATNHQSENLIDNRHLRRFDSTHDDTFGERQLSLRVRNLSGTDQNQLLSAKIVPEIEQDTRGARPRDNWGNVLLGWLSLYIFGSNQKQIWLGCSIFGTE